MHNVLPAEIHPPAWRARFTVAAGAFLAFEGELMAGKQLLPSFGGAAYVWCTVVLFFQLCLVAGYYGSRWLSAGPARRMAVVLLAATGFFSLAAVRLTTWLPLELQPLTALLPYAGLSAALFCLTPLLHQQQARLEDYSVYAWSNAGALLGLIFYPLFVEPNLDLSTQHWIWAGAGLVVCGLIVPGIHRTDTSVARGLGGTRWQWWILPALSSGLMLATTNLISYEAAAGPLAWSFPLAIFLGTCVLAFSGDCRPGVGILAVAGLMSITGMHLLTEVRHPLMVGYALIAGGASMLACNVWLANSRTKNAHGFYVASAVGGACGSALMVLVVPRITNGPVEFPILTLTTLSIAGFMYGGRVIRPLLVTCAVVAIGGTIAAENSGRAQEVQRARSLYGCWRVTKETARPIYKLISNSTLHGQQDRDHPEARMIYYAKDTLLGKLLLEKQQSPAGLNIGVVGLGAGALNCYLRPQDRITYYELDPEAERLARKWFTYLDTTNSKVILGDGRKSLEHEPQTFDVLILDAFNGDAIPMHLLTREAAEVYSRRLAPGGALAVHITNAHVDLLPVVQAMARDMNLGCESQANGRIRWAVLRPNGPPPSGRMLEWTDQRSSLLGLLKH